MEINLEESIHIEFLGIPGSGKSTLSHELAEALRKRGYCVFEPTYVDAHEFSVIGRKIRKVLIVVYVMICKRTLFKRISAIVKCGKKKEYFTHVRNIVPKLLVYLKPKNAIYIWDEGLIQSAISLSVNTDLDVKKVKDEMFSLVNKEKMVSVFLDVDTKTALERIEKRITNDSRVEKEYDYNKKIQFLESYKICCKHLEEGIDITVCSTVNIRDFISCMFKKIEGK